MSGPGIVYLTPTFMIEPVFIRKMIPFRPRRRRAPRRSRAHIGGGFHHSILISSRVKPYFCKNSSRSRSFRISMTSVNRPVSSFLYPATFSPVQMLHRITGDFPVRSKADPAALFRNANILAASPSGNIFAIVSVANFHGFVKWFVAFFFHIENGEIPVVRHFQWDPENRPPGHAEKITLC